jgi:hypothetical protein
MKPWRQTLHSARTGTNSLFLLTSIVLTALNVSNNDCPIPFAQVLIWWKKHFNDEILVGVLCILLIIESIDIKLTVTRVQDKLEWDKVWLKCLCNTWYTVLSIFGAMSISIGPFCHCAKKVSLRWRGTFWCLAASTGINLNKDLVLKQPKPEAKTNGFFKQNQNIFLKSVYHIENDNQLKNSVFGDIWF